LAFLVAPLSVEAFVAKHWNQEALHVPGDPQKFAAIDQTPERFLKVCREAPPDELGLSAVFHEDATGADIELDITADQARQLFRAGMTLLHTEMSTNVLFPALGVMAASLKAALGVHADVQANVFWSPRGKGSGLHFDSKNVFAINLQGTKRWRISRRPP
jgi:hypothetical protein